MRADPPVVAEASPHLEGVVVRPSGGTMIAQRGDVNRLRTLLVLSLLTACAAPSGAGEEGGHGDLEVISEGLTVGGAAGARCSTTSVAPLSEQLIQEVQCLEPGRMRRIDEISGVSLSDATFPFLQTPAADALERAVERRGGRRIYLNSGLRTLPAQYLLYQWYRRGRCGISLAARPGRSNHESGLAIDIDDNGSWRSALGAEGFNWLGSRDPVHFDFVRGGTDLRRLSVLAFQRLWNRNHPEDRIAEDGDYGPQTESRLSRAPAEGFRVGASCGGEPEAPTEPMAVDWERRSDGTYDFRAEAPASISRVVYAIDGYVIGRASRDEGDDFHIHYEFNFHTDERLVEVTGYDAADRPVGLGLGLIDVTEDTAVFIKQMGPGLYEIGLERPPEAVAAIEVRADGFLLRDGVSGSSWSTRHAVRSSFESLGERRFEIATYNADGSHRGTLRRTFVLR
ncbi:MAG: hypothetical protein SangKO_035490 [Sandaracinaceae bacterium]